MYDYSFFLFSSDLAGEEERREKGNSFSSLVSTENSNEACQIEPMLREINCCRLKKKEFYRVVSLALVRQEHL